MKAKTPAHIALLVLFVVGPAHALIIFNGDNLANTTDPGGVPWDATARMANYDGSSVTAVGETAVHLGDGYMLTANHSGNSTHVSFDGSTWLEVDSGFTPQQVAPDVDLKIFKLTSTPITSAVILHDNSGGELNTSGTIVGWGRGREFDAQIGEDIQDFGKDPTIDKRWGTNTIREAASESWIVGSTTYTQDALTAVLGNTEGDNEFALALHDSGSPYFQDIGGTIVLSGIAATRSIQNGGVGDYKATFGDDRLTGSPFGRGDENLFVQVGAYADEIAAIVPEPNNFGLFSSLLATFAIFGLRRRKREFKG
jgi:hypothetical protein